VGDAAVRLRRAFAQAGDDVLVLGENIFCEGFQVVRILLAGSLGRYSKLVEYKCRLNTKEDDAPV
jgi:hypothetical protein